MSYNTFAVILDKLLMWLNHLLSSRESPPSGSIPALQHAMSAATKGATDAFSNVGRHVNDSVSLLQHVFDTLLVVVVAAIFYPFWGFIYKLYH